MMVEIVAVEDPSAAEPRVEVRSALGQFAGRWSGPEPRVGDKRSVELSFDHTFTWNVDIVAVEPQPHAIGPGRDGGVVVCAGVEELDESGALGLRLGPSVIMAEAFGEPPPVGATVRLDAPAVTLSDADI
jgi:hypothetical protein